MTIFKRRRAEPSAIYSFRLSFLFFTSLTIVGYLTIQIQDIINEIPSIRVKYNESDSLPMPAILISSSVNRQFRIDCTFRDENDSTFVGKELTKKIIEGRKYCSNFTVENTVNNTKAVLILPGDNQTYSSGTSGFYSTLYSEETMPGAFYISIFDQTLAPSIKDLKIPENFDSNFIRSLYNLNNYTILKDNNLIFKTSRKLRRAIIPSKFVYLGIPPQFLDEYYVTSTYVSRYGPNMNNPIYSTFQLYYQNHLTTIEEQYKDKTVLKLLGLLGGAISLMLTVHALLFGITPLSPWGIIYLIPCISKPTYKKLQDEFDENLLPEDLSEESQIIKMRKMINRLNRLDIYLKNCINTEKLEESEKKIKRHPAMG